MCLRPRLDYTTPVSNLRVYPYSMQGTYWREGEQEEENYMHWSIHIHIAFSRKNQYTIRISPA